MQWFHLARALAGGHRAISNSQLATLDVHFRKLCRSIGNRRRRLIGMRLRPRFFTYGTNGSGARVLLQVPAPIRGVTSHAKKYSKLGKACCHFACASVGSTFALLASFKCSTCGPSTTYVGIKASSVLQVHEYWVLEREKLVCMKWYGTHGTHIWIRLSLFAACK